MNENVWGGDLPHPHRHIYTHMHVHTHLSLLIVLTKHWMTLLFFVDSEVHTKMTMLVQVAFYGAMHKMLKGAYNSG